MQQRLTFDVCILKIPVTMYNVATARSLESLVLYSVEYCLQHLKVEGGLLVRKVAYLNVIVTGIKNTYNVICSYFVTA